MSSSCFTRRFLISTAALLVVTHAIAQSIAVPWSVLGHNAQHTAISLSAADTLNKIEWQTPVDQDPQYSGSVLYIHYGSPLVTRANTVVIPVKTGQWGGFQVEGLLASSGSLVWTQATDYILPTHDWIPSCGIAVTPSNRLYFPGAGGTVYYRDNPDSATSGTGQIAFYGMANYLTNEANYQADVQIDTPITSDRYGDIFFGFEVSGTTLGLQSGIARIDSSGSGAWISAVAASGSDPSIEKVTMNCAPALSNDHKTLYVTVNTGDDLYATGYLVSLDSRTLAPIAKVQVKDVGYPANDAYLPDDGTASPTVGPDGDVYIGVLENPFPYNHDRGWMLHFDSTLSVTKIPGAFGWDDTPSIVPASAVPSYSGSSASLLLTKYNNYAGVGGNGVNKVAVLDPDVSETDPISGQTVMNEVITVTGVTPDPDYDSQPQYSNAVREWCINSAAVDPATKCAIVNSEDGNVYRWDFTTNSLMQAVTLSSGVGEAYTPSLVGPDGTIYVINNAQLFSVGQ
jgi:hypothetical protein